MRESAEKENKRSNSNLLIAELIAMIIGSVAIWMATKSEMVTIAFFSGLSMIFFMVIWATKEIVSAIEAQHKKSADTEADGYVCKESPLAKKGGSNE